MESLHNIKVQIEIDRAEHRLVAIAENVVYFSGY